MKAKLFWFISILFFSNAVNADQLTFEKEKKENGYIFNYQWTDQNNKVQQLSFELTKKALLERFRHFKEYKPEIASANINQLIHRRVRANPIKHVQVRFKKQADNITIEISGNKQELVDQAKTTIALYEQEFTEQYLTDNFYHQFTTYDRTQGVKPNHVAIANHSVADFKPIKATFLQQVSIKNIRVATNYTLGFVQSIPYSTLQSRVTSSGAGFNPPAKLLWENQGDCDSKVTLSASLLRMLMPRVKMVMVFIDNHALIGVEVLTIKGEQTIEHEGITYALAEPTGPQMLKLGDIGSEAEIAIANGHYVVEKYHSAEN